MSRPPNVRVRRYAAVLGVGGTGAAAMTWSWLPAAPAPDPALWIPLLVVAVLSIWVPLRFQHGEQAQGFNLEEGVLVAALLTMPASWTVALLTGAAVVGYGLRVREPVKVAFNVGQTALWASAGVLVFHAILPEPPAAVFDVRTLAAVLAGSVVLNLLSVVLMGELLRRLGVDDLVASVKDVLPVHAATWFGNTAIGLLLGLVARVEPMGVLLVTPLIAGLYLGYRGFARALDEQRRMDRLHSVTTHLVRSFAERDTLQTFLSGLAELFSAENVVFARRTEDGLDVLQLRDGEDHGIAQLIREVISQGEAPFDRAREAAGAICAPLTLDGRPVGAIAVTGRRGVEPWDAADLKLLGAVANEAAIALKNLDLFQQVEQERARWEAESTKLGDIVNAASDGIAMFSSDGTIQTWNAAMAAMTGLPADQALGQPWFVVLRLRDAEGVEMLPAGGHAIARAIEGQRYRDPIEFQMLRRDGAWRYLRATFAPIHHEDARPEGTVMVARDVTTDREVEALKADFVATVSHELRTPLTPLRGFLQTLVAHRHQLDEDQVETIYGSMDSQLGRLERLIADLLVVADLDRGASQFEAENVDLLEAATVAVTNEASSDTVRIDVTGVEGVIVRADGKAVVRIIRALASNALKHTEGRVEIRTEAAGSEGVVRVRDEGPGIPPWEQKEVFKRFHRLGDHLTRNQGPGLGLPIAAALAERLGGKVTVESDIGQGSTFSLWLPSSGPRLVDSPDAGTRAS